MSKGQIVLFDGRGAEVVIPETRKEFEGARHSRLTADWITSQTSLDADLRWSMITLINRARWFEQNSEYGEGYLKLIERNVVGPDPFQLQMKIRNPDGSHDKAAEAAIEAAWKDWGKKRNCCITGSMSLFDHYKVCARAMVRDGGHLIRKHPGRGKYGFQIESMDIDFLDPDYNVALKDGSRIVMGIELDLMNSPVAYHLRGTHPGDTYWRTAEDIRTRVPASQIIHPFIRKRSNQNRGYTEFASIMPNMRQMKGYKEATIVNARTSASKMGFFTKNAGELSEYSGGNADYGGKYMDAEPGSMEELPQGLNFTPWDPKQPTTGYAEFTKENLRGDASALGVAYMTLANDPGDANFSSARVGVVEEREGFKMIQKTMIEHVCEDLFDDWLFFSLQRGAIKTSAGSVLPHKSIDRFNNPTFRGRRWQWLDPRADSEAAKNDIEMGIVSNAQVAGERGGDEEETLDEIEETIGRRAAVGLINRERLEAIQIGKKIEEEEQTEKPSPLIASIGVGGVQALSILLPQIASGQISMEAGIELMVTVFGFTPEQAAKVSIPGKAKPDPVKAIPEVSKE